MAKRIVKKGTPKITKILGLTALGIGAYLLFTRKARAEEITEEFIPDERLQDQLDEQLFTAPPSTIIERATEEANLAIQQIQQEAAKTIKEVREKADEQLAALQRQMETAYELKQEDLIQEYRQRDEIVRAEAEEKIRAAQQEAARLVQAAREEADRKVQAAREEAYITQKSSLESQLRNKEAELNQLKQENNSYCEILYFSQGTSESVESGTSYGPVKQISKADFESSFRNIEYLIPKSPGEKKYVKDYTGNMVGYWYEIRNPVFCESTKSRISLLSIEIGDLKNRIAQLG